MHEKMVVCYETDALTGHEAILCRKLSVSFAEISFSMDELTTTASHVIIMSLALGKNMYAQIEVQKPSLTHFPIKRQTTAISNLNFICNHDS
jgi:hypothetical protein